MFICLNILYIFMYLRQFFDFQVRISRENVQNTAVSTEKK